MLVQNDIGFFALCPNAQQWNGRYARDSPVGHCSSFMKGLCCSSPSWFSMPKWTHACTLLPALATHAACTMRSWSRALSAYLQLASSGQDGVRSASIFLELDPCYPPDFFLNHPYF